MLNDIDDLLTDDDSVDYLPPNQQPLEPQVQVQKTVHKFQTLMKQTRVHQELQQTAHWTLQVLK